VVDDEWVVGARESYDTVAGNYVEWVGDLVRAKTEGYGGLPMRVDVYRRPPERVAGWLREAGFGVEAQLVIDPGAEVPGAVVFARRR
jgi:hypothetical protein